MLPMVEMLARGPVHVYMLSERLADVPRHNDWLTRREREHLANLRVIKRRSDWRLGRWTAKRLLESTWGRALSIRGPLDLEIRAAEDGAPVAYVRGEAAPVSVSISHSAGLAFCAATESGVLMGCDAELVAPRSHGFVSDFFTVREQAVVEREAGGDGDVVATAIWSVKESVLKAVREGLRRDTRSVEVSLNSNRLWGGWHEARAACRMSGSSFHVSWRHRGRYIHALALGDAGKS